MRFCVLGSGSKGNCTYIEVGATKLLIDAGFTAIEIERRLAGIGVEATTLSAILITHEHSDHIRGVSVLSRRYGLPVLASSATIEASGVVLAKLHSHTGFMPGVTFKFADLEIHPFSVSHDAADPVGFLISDGTLTFGYCTDTGTVSRLIQHRLSGCHALVIESNHDPDMLRNGPYPPALKQRVRSKTGHLANQEAATLLADLIHEDLKHVTLAHISETNNRPELVRECVSHLCGFKTLRIALAGQDEAGELVDLSGLVC